MASLNSVPRTALSMASVLHHTAWSQTRAVQGIDYSGVPQDTVLRPHLEAVA